MTELKILSQGIMISHIDICLVGEYNGSMKQKLILGVVSGVAIASVASALLAHSTQTNADFDLPGLNQQVQNHEARIANTENDVKALQDQTKTAPAPSPVPVPVVTTQPVATTASPAPTPPPTPVVGAPVIINSVPYCSNDWNPPTHLWRISWSDGPDTVSDTEQRPHVSSNNPSSTLCWST